MTLQGLELEKAILRLLVQVGTPMKTDEVWRTLGAHVSYRLSLVDVYHELQALAQRGCVDHMGTDGFQLWWLTPAAAHEATRRSHESTAS